MSCKRSKIEQTSFTGLISGYFRANILANFLSTESRKILIIGYNKQNLWLFLRYLYHGR